MNVTMILEMVASAGERTVVTAGGRSLGTAELLRLARAAAARFRGHTAVVYLAANDLAYPVALFGAALAGVPFVPLNYRLGDQQLAALLARHPGAIVLRPADLGSLLEPTAPEAAPIVDQDPDAVAVLLYTSGTTAEPKAAVLRHRHLVSYLFNTQEFGSADADAAALVSVPPYHVAGLTNLLSNLYSGRRVVYLAAFDPVTWLDTVRAERATHAMLVPTMLARIVAAVRGDDAETPSLRTIAYGGARTPRSVLERALRIFPEVGFVNAYGLTETASSVAVLGPEDHRAAIAASDPAVADRLGSVGRTLPGIEIEVRTETGAPAAVGEPGLVYVRGEQISGEYAGQAGNGTGDWFATRDRGRLDADGYLFIEGRADDTIIRGGENIAPEEIEDVLLGHPAVAEVAVLGAPDTEWGQRIVAFVVPAGGTVPDEAALRQWVTDRLRSSKTPDSIVFRDELPRTDTGKLLRRNLLVELETTDA